LAALDAIDDACARHGLDGVTTLARQYRPLPASVTRAATYPTWVCPHGACDRVVLPGEEGSNPPSACALAGGLPMRQYRVGQ
jgi:hypothetical protein